MEKIVVETHVSDVMTLDEWFEKHKESKRA